LHRLLALAHGCESTTSWQIRYSDGSVDKRARSYAPVNVSKLSSIHRTVPHWPGFRCDMGYFSEPVQPNLWTQNTTDSGYGICTQ